MQGYSFQAKLYITIIVALSIPLLIYLYIANSGTEANLFSMLALFIVTLLAEVLPVELPMRTKVSVGMALWFTNLALFPPFYATLIVGFSLLFATIIDQPKKDFVLKVAFNTAQVILAVGWSSLLLQYLSDGTGWTSLNYVIALVISAIVCSFLNISLVLVLVALADRVSLLMVWKANYKWCLVNVIALLPLGFLNALIFKSSGIFGIILFMVPLLIARRSFQLYMDMRQTYMETIESLAAAIDAKDNYTRGHSERVARLTVSIARHLNIPEDRVEILKPIALLHDTGKIAVPEGILNKPSRLNDQEFDLMKQHPVTGANIIRGINFLRDGYKIILHHHERWDGQGYPDGLKGKDIPLGARIIAVADAFDAMTSDRPYRAAMTWEQALNELVDGAGSQFDPEVVGAFEVIFTDMGQEMRDKLTQPEVADVESAELAEAEDVQDVGNLLEAEGDISNVH